VPRPRTHRKRARRSTPPIAPPRRHDTSSIHATAIAAAAARGRDRRNGPRCHETAAAAPQIRLRYPERAQPSNQQYRQASHEHGMVRSITSSHRRYGRVTPCSHAARFVGFVPQSTRSRERASRDGQKKPHSRNGPRRARMPGQIRRQQSARPLGPNIVASRSPCASFGRDTTLRNLARQSRGFEPRSHRRSRFQRSAVRNRAGLPLTRTPARVPAVGSHHASPARSPRASGPALGPPLRRQRQRAIGPETRREGGPHPPLARDRFVLTLPRAAEQAAPLPWCATPSRNCLHDGAHRRRI